MKPLRILIVEDDGEQLAMLAELYRTIFVKLGYQPALEQATTADEARRLAKAAKHHPYDFASLDVNLGDAVLSGLEVLETLKRFHSAWMVVLLTGVESDPTVDATMGKLKGERLRKELRRDAYARFPAERLLVVEKPSSKLPKHEARSLLRNRLEQIALVYEEVGRLRYVFRPIEVSSLERVPQPKGQKGKRRFIDTTALHWQIRFDCGEIRTLPNMSGFKTLHYLLSREQDASVTPEEALAIEPKAEKIDALPKQDEDPLAAYFEAQGITWKELSPPEQEKLIRAALSLKFNRYRELRGFEDDEDLSPAEESELNGMIRELGPLADAAETAYQRMKLTEHAPGTVEEVPPGLLAQSDLHRAGGNYDKLGEDRKGKDSPAAQLFRARMKRVKDCLRENGFADFAQHIEAYVMSTGANWSYNPPERIAWTT
ncbi:MAG: response regulator [Verrucomicrobiota bacterium]